jgi:tetratricopeptide (TPR) repeat protein
MSACQARVVLVVLASLGLLTGCETSTKLGDLLQSQSSDPQATGALAEATPGTTLAGQPAPSDPASTGTVTTDGLPPVNSAGLLGSDPNDDLNQGKKQFRANNFGIAERYFRRAVETHPRDAEAWVGLAASYDRLRRFELADRAYRGVIGIIGETPEVLNNQGYSYMLRGDYARARSTLMAAQAKDAKNPYIRNNIALLEKSFRGGKAIQ